MSLVCIDELKLLKDIEKLISRKIPEEQIEGFEPDPSIKAQPINKGRGQQQKSAGRKPSRKKPADNKPSRPGKYARQKAAGNNGNSNSSKKPSPWKKQTNKNSRRNAA